MNVKDYIVDKIYDICIDSLNNIQPEEWNTLNRDVSNYLTEQDIQLELNLEEAFSIKLDEKEKLRYVVNKIFNTYPLIETFFDNNRDWNFPPFNMMNVIRRWCNDIVEELQEYNEIETESEYSTNEEIYESDREEDDNSEIDDEYITIHYFQGLFMAIYDMFMNREI